MKKGFTLIELLVVISIIGILASIVMVSMSGATASAKDARVKGAASQVRSLAEIINDQDGNYDALCGSATGLNTAHGNYGDQLRIIQDDVDGNCSSSISASCADCYDSATTWCYAVELETGDYWCADYTGIAVATTSNSCSSTHIACY